MKREEVVALCRRARDVGKVRHEDYCDYIVPMEKRRRSGDEWVTVESAYMSVDGKLAMANEDHRLQGKRLDFMDPVVLVDNEEQLTLQIIVVSEVYGRRHGIATSRRNGSSPVERQFPWEVAETSAIGRALSTMGYGLLPGAGLTSAEDAARAMEREPEEAALPSASLPAKRTQSRLTPTQKTKLVELYSSINGLDGAAAQKGIESTFAQRFGHVAAEGTYDEGVQLIGQLMKEQRAKLAPDAKPEAPKPPAAEKPVERQAR
jgi:hypothetical protein